jgi:hypothetical protein
LLQEPDYYQEAVKYLPRLRWLSQAVRLSRLLRLEELIPQFNEKVSRLQKRRPDLDPETRALIVENLMRAKILRRLRTWRTHHYEPAPAPARQAAFSSLVQPEQRCSIVREKNFRLGRFPAILVPGFIPDGNEAFFLLRRSFLKHGPVFYLNYPPHHFDKQVVFSQLYDVIADLNRRRLKSAGTKPKPFLVGTSFGCRMLVSFLAWLRENGLTDELSIRGLILLSPVLCLEDIVDPAEERQKTLVGRAVAHLCQVQPDDHQGIDQAMARARSIFSKMFNSGRDNLRFAERDQLSVLAIEDEVLRIFDPEFTPNQGIFKRYLGLKNEESLKDEFLTDLPTLVLFAEGETDVLTANSPTQRQLMDPQRLQAIFPNGHVEVVYSLDQQRRVTHSDLIFQAERYLAHIKPWLKIQTS